MAKYLDSNGVSTLWGQIKNTFRTEAQVNSQIDAKLQSALGDNGTVKVAIDNAVSSIVNNAPEAFDTLKEISDWIEENGSEASSLITDISKKVDKEIVGSNGKGRIFNEADGGGAKFEHNDGSESFVGVNDGGENGLMAQIYADKKIEGQWVGSRINVYHDGIFYVSKENQQNGKLKNAADCEIATIGDIPVALTSEEIIAACV